MLIILIIVLLLRFRRGGGYYGYNRWGAGGGAGIGLGTVLVFLLVCYLLGVFRSAIWESDLLQALSGAQHTQCLGACGFESC